MEQFYGAAKELLIIIPVVGLIMIGLWFFLRKK
jgi:hypothetical protein